MGGTCQSPSQRQEKAGLNRNGDCPVWMAPWGSCAHNFRGMARRCHGTQAAGLRGKAARTFQTEARTEERQDTASRTHSKRPAVPAAGLQEGKTERETGEQVGYAVRSLAAWLRGVHHVWVGEPLRPLTAEVTSAGQPGSQLSTHRVFRVAAHPKPQACSEGGAADQGVLAGPSWDGPCTAEQPGCTEPLSSQAPSWQPQLRGPGCVRRQEEGHMPGALVVFLHPEGRTSMVEQSPLTHALLGLLQGISVLS